MHQKDGPNHLGLWCYVLPDHQMALITSGCVPFSCGRDGGLHPADPASDMEAIEVRDPTTWTVLQKYDPN